MEVSKLARSIICPGRVKDIYVAKAQCPSHVEFVLHEISPKEVIVRIFLDWWINLPSRRSVISTSVEK